MTGSTRWSAERVLALAADQLSARAARGLARAETWSRTGSSERGVWGHCQGSRATPYQTAVALGGPSYRCSCPSRKVPCKHALALLLLWSNGTVRPADEPDWAVDWLTRPDQAEPRRRGAVVDPEAARARAERRAERVAGGVAELRTWLNDRMHRGLAGFEQQGWAELNRLAARMVDAQAPGLAGSLRRAAGTIGRGQDWPGRLLEELSMVHLAAAAHERLGELPGPLAETVRSRIGWTTGTEQVLSAGSKVEDDWLVLGQVLEPDERLTVRRIWLRGLRTGRIGLLLSFAANGQALEVPPAGPGETVRAIASFYPGAGAVRALLVPPADHPAADAGDPSRATGAPAGAIASATGPGGMPAGESAPPDPADDAGTDDHRPDPSRATGADTGAIASATAPDGMPAGENAPPDPADDAGDHRPDPSRATSADAGAIASATAPDGMPAGENVLADSADDAGAGDHRPDPSRGTSADAGAIASATGPDGMPAGEIEGGLRGWPAGVGVAGALAEFAAALGVDPWLERWPVVLAGVRPARDGDGWALVDGDGDALGLAVYVDPWALLATSAGAPLTVAAELGRDGLLRPMTGWQDGRAVVLA